MKSFLKTWSPLLALAVVAVLAFMLGADKLAALIGGGGMAMAIGFNSVPSNLRVPFVTAEFDNSRAEQGASLLPYRGLIIGQKTSAGTATANTLVRVTNVSQAQVYGGRGSMLHLMAKAWFNQNKFTELYLGVLADNGSGVLATKTLTVTGPATAAGTLSARVGGKLVQVSVASGDSSDTIATALAAALTADLDLPVTAAAASSVVTTTARNKGTVGQDLDIRFNYQDGEAFPAGVSVAVANGVSGATNPVLTSLIAAMGDTWFHVIAQPYHDATSLTALETDLSSRFGPMRMIDGVAITSAVGSNSTLGTLGDTRNSPHSVIVGQPGASPLTGPAEFAAAVAGAVAYYANIDPARPLQTLPLVGVLPPAEADLFTLEERNLMLYDGIGTTKVAGGGVVQLERLVTTYQTNAAGASDTSYLDVTTMLTLLYLRYSWRNRIASRYPRHKLTNDDTRIGSGQAVITPKIGKAEAVAWFMEMEELGLVEGLAQFKRDLVVERNTQDPDRLDFLLSPDVINQLVVSATKFQFLL